MIQPADYLEQVREYLSEKGNLETAEQQMKYMRSQFEFYGVKAPQWVGFSKACFREIGVYQGDALVTFVRACLEDDHREVNYFGIEMVQQAQKKESEAFIWFLEELILEKPWWDTVDWLAKLVGIHFKNYPDQIRPVTGKWIKSPHFWLQRVAILFQLYYKEATDESLLFDYIKAVADSKEFFLQKASGWALRQYSRTNPKAVLAFVQQHPLSALTVREGLKVMKKQGLV